MRKSLSAALSLALLGLFVSSPVFAQTKTAKACRDEWKANKADNQAKGITEKAYVTQCRADAAPATPPAAATTTAPTVKPDTSTKPATMPTVAAPAAKPPTAKPAPVAVPAPSASDQFASEALAKGHCPSDTIVWANLKSKIYHFTGNKTYGTTKNGAYMCEKESMAGGFRAAKNEKHP
jgi:hypothetical protein